jgi:tyrosyl-tRNA synthetase
MLPGFKEGHEKMSKSDPSSTIFMEDDKVYISHGVFFSSSSTFL